MTARARVKKVCFFITPIGKADSPERKRADQVQKYILREVLAAKYKIVRADELPHPGSITHQIISLLYHADLVVADLTGSNANVAYELAVRHAFNKVSIHLIDKEDDIPFDLKDERTIVFDLNDPDSLNACKEEMKKFVRTIVSGKVQYNSPVFRTLSVAAATAEEKAGFLEKMAEQIESIATDVSSLESTVTMSDIDQIDSIKDSVEELGKQQENILTKFTSADVTLRKILKKLG
jgi:methyl-accepting chemotaxis protein